MKLSELYRKKLGLIQLFQDKAENTSDYLAKDSFRSRIYEAQGDAGLIAHCIAFYGDCNIEDMPLDALWDPAQEMPCIGENPWARGLRVIRLELETP